MLHEWKFFNFILETPDEAIGRIDDIGGPNSHTNYPWGWSQAGNTPFKWYKQNTHEGGVHVPLIMHWPARITSDARTGTGNLRDQFHHVNDIVPTIYEALGVTAPATYRGYEQMPITGTSMLSTFDAPDAPTEKGVQYFEMMGHRAIYTDGWKAVTRHQAGTPFDDDQWELYHYEQDRSECNDLAADACPRNSPRWSRCWWEEAEEHGVLPLDDRTIELFGARFRDRSPHREDRHYTYRPPMSPLPAQVGASIGGRSWDLDATIDRPAGAGGVLYATGTGNSGVSVFIQNDRLVFDYNCFGDHFTRRIRPAGAGGRGGRRRAIPPHRQGRARDARHRRCRVRNGRVPVRDADHLEPRAERRLRPRFTGERSLRRRVPFEGHLDRVDIQLVSERPADAAANAAATGRATMSQQ